MILRVTFLLIFVGMFNSCIFEGADSTLLVRMRVGTSSASTNNFGRWIVVSNYNGEVLATKEITKSDSEYVDVRGPRTGEKIIVTVCGFVTYDYPTSPTGIKLDGGIQTYQAIPTGSTFEFPLGSTSPIPDLKGKASLRVSDLTSSDINFTDVYNANNFITDKVQTGSLLTLNLNLRDDNSDILAVGLKNNVPVYQWLRGVKPGDAVTISWNSFLSSKVISTNRKILYLTPVKGCPVAGSDRGYLLGPYGLIPGYIDGFDHYITNIGFEEVPNKVTVEYYKKGSVPTSVTYPDFTYKRPTGLVPVKDFSFEFSTPYTYQSIWFYGNNAQQTSNWQYFAPAGEKLVPLRLPDDIFVRFPNLNVDIISGGSIGLIQRLDGVSYEESILKYPPNFMPAVEMFTYMF